jgi:hypothetical protein
MTEPKTTKSKDGDSLPYREVLLGITVMSALYALIFAPSYFDNRAKATAPQCWDLREIAGEAFKINKCTGVVERVPPAPSPSPSAVPR